MAMPPLPSPGSQKPLSFGVYVTPVLLLVMLLLCDGQFAIGRET
jgi:hypothetical protein